jgi:hypothetical protein
MSCSSDLLRVLQRSKCKAGYQCCDNGTLTKPLSDHRDTEKGLRPDFRICSDPEPIEIDCGLLKGMHGHTANVGALGTKFNGTFTALDVTSNPPREEYFRDQGPSVSKAEATAQCSGIGSGWGLMKGQQMMAVSRFSPDFIDCSYSHLWESKTYGIIIGDGPELARQRDSSGKIPGCGSGTAIFSGDDSAPRTSTYCVHASKLRENYFRDLGPSPNKGVAKSKCKELGTNWKLMNIDEMNAVSNLNPDLMVCSYSHLEEPGRYGIVISSDLVAKNGGRAIEGCGMATGSGIGDDSSPRTSTYCVNAIQLAKLRR